MLQLFASDATDDDVMARHPELERLRTYKGYKTVEQYRDWAKAQRAAINKELDSMPGRIDEASKAKREEVPLPEDEENHRHLQMEKAKVSMKINSIRSGTAQLDVARRKSEAEALLSERRATYMGKFLHANDTLNADAQKLRKEISDKEHTLFLLKHNNKERVLLMENLRQETNGWGKNGRNGRISALTKLLPSALPVGSLCRWIRFRQPERRLICPAVGKSNRLTRRGKVLKNGIRKKPRSQRRKQGNR